MAGRIEVKTIPGTVETLERAIEEKQVEEKKEGTSKKASKKKADETENS